jgi:hypothetical protein
MKRCLTSSSFRKGVRQRRVSLLPAGLSVALRGEADGALEVTGSGCGPSLALGFFGTSPPTAMFSRSASRVGVRESTAKGGSGEALRSESMGWRRRSTRLRGAGCRWSAVDRGSVLGSTGLASRSSSTSVGVFASCGATCRGRWHKSGQPFDPCPTFLAEACLFLVSSAALRTKGHRNPAGHAEEQSAQGLDISMVWPTCFVLAI